MSHFNVLVVGSTPVETLRAFEVSKDTFNIGLPPKITASFLGGHWFGFLKLKEGKTGTSGTNLLPSRKQRDNYVDSAYKKNIDFIGMWDDTEQEVAELYDRYKEAVGNIEPPTYEQYYYWDTHPWVHALKEANLYSSADPLGYWLTQSKDSRADFLLRNTYHALIPHAILINGIWFSKDTVYWCGLNEKDQLSWEQLYMKLVDSVNDNTILSLYDCFIEEAI